MNIPESPSKRVLIQLHGALNARIPEQPLDRKSLKFGRRGLVGSIEL